MTLKKSNYIHLAIMFILAFGISYLPPFGQVTPFGMKAIGVFVSVLYGWIFFDLFWTSIYGFMIIPILGLNTVTGAFAAGLANQMLITVMLSMAFAVAIDMAGVTDIMANWLLQRKLLHKSPWFLVSGLLIIGAIIGSIGPGMAAIFLLWGIVLKIADFCNIKKGDPLLSFMIMMIPVFTMTASFIFPFKGGVLIYIAYLMQVTDVGIPGGSFILYAFVTIVLIFALVILAARFVLKIDAGIMPTIMATVKPIVSSLGAVPFMIVSMIILGLLTQVTHNIVLGAMFMPFLLPLCQAAGGNMYTLWFMLFITLNMAYCTPAGSFQAALVFGHESMERKHAYLYGIMLLIITFIVYSCVGIPLGNVLFAALI